MKKLIPLMVFMVVLVSFVSAASIHGEIYDFDLEKVINVRVEIDTSPRQVLISKDGSYSFNVPNGDYTIKIEHRDSFAEEVVIIRDDGEYVLDIILFPKIDESSLDESIDLSDDYFDSGFSVWYVLIIIVVLGLIFWKFRKKSSKEEIVEVRKDLDQLVEIVKDADGRINQKEIRKKMGLSEAKISLMIAELEADGKVKKIKKGRGNIIILK